MRDVVAAVEVIVDEDFPVAIDVVSPAVEVIQLADAKRSNSLDQAAEEFREWSGVVVEIDEDEALPGFNPNRNEAVLRAVEILDALEFGHALQRTIEPIIPAVIRTMQERGLAAGFGLHGSCVMAADIEEGTQNAVVAADPDDGVPGYPGAHELPWGFH